MSSLIDGGGGRLDLLVRFGADLPALTLTFTNDDGSVYDMTGCTLVVRAATREVAPEQLILTAAFVGSPALGVVSLSMAAAETEKLVPPASGSSRPRVGGDYVLDVVSAGGTVTATLYGEISVRYRPPEEAP